MKNKTTEKTIQNSNFFVMERPSKENDQILTLKTKEIDDEDEFLHSLTYDAFFDVILNLSHRLSPYDHKNALRSITSVFSLHKFLEDEKSAYEVITNFIASEKNEKIIKHLESIPDHISQLEFIIRFNFDLFSYDSRKKLDYALKKHKKFLDEMERIFFKLPVCFSFNLLDLLRDAESSYKKTRRRT